MGKAGIFAAITFVALLSIWGKSAKSSPDKYELTEPNGIAFSEIRGYETWKVIAASRRTDVVEIQAVLGNPEMVASYQSGTPGNGRPFPDGVKIVKIVWAEKQSRAFPAAFEPGGLRRIDFIMKDSKRFPATNGWGYARFVYDGKTDAFAPWAPDNPAFARQCHLCHSIVKAKDFIFTSYARR